MDLRRDEGQREAQLGGQLRALRTPQLAEAGDEQQSGVDGDGVGKGDAREGGRLEDRAPRRLERGDGGEEAGERPVTLRCDSRQIRQALTNLLQNALDAIEGRQQAEGDGAAPGSILVTIEPRGDAIVTTVADNGRGLPDTERDRLTEPYVTTREKGTGLGLAIVKKIMEDHGGSIELRDRPEGGAAVSLVFSTPPTVLNETNPALAYHGQ